MGWLRSLPYFINSNDLGTVFVHAGIETRLRLHEQDPWVMMTLRSILPDGKASTRCYHKYPWAKRWRGPMTVIFGHDAARGLQTYDSAIGLDTGCVYGGRLTAYELPEKILHTVPARKTYLSFGTSRNHKVYLNGMDKKRGLMMDGNEFYLKREEEELMNPEEEGDAPHDVNTSEENEEDLVDDKDEEELEESESEWQSNDNPLPLNVD